MCSMMQCALAHTFVVPCSTTGAFPLPTRIRSSKCQLRTRFPRGLSRGWGRRVALGIEVRASVATEQLTSSQEETGVVIIGAGLAGLAAATQCAKSGVPFLLLEGSDGVGGRVRTDSYQGFLLDRGFQIFITAYPEAQAVLNYEALDLRTFYAGALVWYNGTFHRVADPLRHFADGVGSLFNNPIGSIRDKLTVGTLRVRAAVKSVADILTSAETTILSRLRSEGLSEAMIDRFFRPFFGGIFFDRELQTTSRLFEFVFKCLALGSNTLPAAGIGAIPQQLAANLPEGSLLLDSRVAKLVENGVILENGRCITVLSLPLKAPRLLDYWARSFHLQHQLRSHSEAQLACTSRPIPHPSRSRFCY